MSEAALRSWLAAHGLESLTDKLHAEDVTLDVLGELSEADLRELGLSLGMRRRLRKALQAGSAKDSPIAEPAAEPAGEPAIPAARVSPSDASTPERRRITVVFIDLVGSTALAANVDPEQLREHINTFQRRASAVVTRYQGFVARFMGDGLLAYFGYPAAHEDDAERAVHAGLEVIASSAELVTETGPAQVRIGIASGLVVVGDILSAGDTREHSVIGETPNLAARLQSIAEPGQLVVSASTRRLVGGSFRLRSLGMHELKGFERPVEAYAVASAHSDRTRFDAHVGANLMPLMGRDLELSLLLERWSLARGGEGQAVLLAGEAGIGKSRITHALLERLRAEGARLLLYQCSPLHLDSPLWPILEQLRVTLPLEAGRDAALQHASVQAAFAHKGADAAADVALIAEALGLPAAPDRPYPQLPAQQKRIRVLQALVAQLLALAKTRPLLVVVEDVHWIDPSTMELLATVLEAIGNAPVMLLMTTRPEHAPALAAHPHVTTLTLNRLSRQAVQGIIRNIVGVQPFNEELLGGIVSRTDGVPLFVEELTKAVLEAGLSLYVPAQTHAPEQLSATIPDTLHDSLMARLDRVPGLKGVAQIAACIGREFDFALLASLCDLPQEQLLEALDGLVAAGLVFSRGSPPHARYSFKHALVRDAAYESMLNTQRRAVHTRIADLLESGEDSASPELVGLHAANAGDLERAIKAYLVAGQQAAHGSANEEAVSHYRRALTLLARLPAAGGRDERELDILRLLGVPLIAVRGYASPEVEQVFERARGLCETLGIEDTRRFTVLRGLWNCWYDRSRLAESTLLARQLVELAAAHDDAAESALAYRALGSTLYVQGDLAGGAAAFERVLNSPAGWSTAATRAAHGEAPEIVSLQYAGWVAVQQGRPDSGLALVEEALERARTIQLPIAVAFSLSILQLVKWLRGDAPGCARTAAETRLMADEHGLVFWRAHSEVFAGWAAAQSSPDRQALAQTRAGLDAWMRTGAMLHVPTWSCVLADVAIAVGALDEAAQVLERAHALAEQHGEHLMLPELLRLSASVQRLNGEPAAAHALLERALQISQQHGSHWLGLDIATDLAAMLESAGNRAAAVSTLDAALGRVSEGRGCPPFERAQALRERLGGAG